MPGLVDLFQLRYEQWSSTLILQNTCQNNRSSYCQRIPCGTERHGRQRVRNSLDFALITLQKCKTVTDYYFHPSHRIGKGSGPAFANLGDGAEISFGGKDIEVYTTSTRRIQMTLANS